MPILHDRELEHFKRTVDLVEYAKKTGYEPRPGESVQGLTVLEHPNRDRIVVAQIPGGPWIYAAIGSDKPRDRDESPERAAQRLREAIARATDKGSIVEFVQQRDWTARAGEVPLERVRERLRDYRADGLPLDFEGPLRLPREGGRRDRSIAPEGHGPQAPGTTGGPHPNPELNRRRYDWTPPPVAPPETEVEQRLRRWREAQDAIDRTRRPPEVPSPDAPSPPRAVRGPEGTPLATAPKRDRAGDSNEKAELGRRRYDWTPPPKGVDAIPRGPRGRNPDRGR